MNLQILDSVLFVCYIVSTVGISLVGYIAVREILIEEYTRRRGK